jgi:hypothetical protein
MLAVLLGLSDDTITVMRFAQDGIPVNSGAVGVENGDEIAVPDTNIKLPAVPVMMPDDAIVI